MMYVQTSLKERELIQEQIDSVFAILEDWFQAIEDGTVQNRLPDPNFQPPPGRPDVTESFVDEFIKELDREINIDASGIQGQKYQADACSDFYRLAYPQRVALVQRLLGIVSSEKEIVQRADAERPEN